MDVIQPEQAERIVSLFNEMGIQQAEWQVEKGWAEEGDRLRMRAAPDGDGMISGNAEDALRNYYIAKLALITTEVAEAIEEIRNGHGIGEQYLSYPPVPPSLAAEFSSGAEAREYWESTQLGKPEGVLSEAADCVIRLWSLFGEAGLPLGEAIVNKLNYNATRALKHGGKAI